jgi:hypothetical protein
MESIKAKQVRDFMYYIHAVIDENDVVERYQHPRRKRHGILLDLEAVFVSIDASFHQ